MSNVLITFYAVFTANNIDHSRFSLRVVASFRIKKLLKAQNVQFQRFMFNEQVSDLCKNSINIIIKQ
jgi:hypothetical protein